jgi:hypothetical protein
MSYAPADWWPEAARRPVRWAGATHPWAARPLGWVLHVVVGDGSPWATFDRSTPPNRRFSHWWVAKDGRAEQYAPSSVASWAQGGGNGTYWSVETEGMPGQPLTDAQVATLARLHRWLGVADRIAASPVEVGISCHFVGGQAWGGHTCPDPAPGAGPRSHQRADIIRRAQTGDDDMPTADEVAAAVVDKWLAIEFGNRTIGQVIGQTSLDAAAAAKNTAVSSTAGLDPAAVATAIITQLGPVIGAAVADELSRRLVR